MSRHFLLLLSLLCSINPPAQADSATAVFAGGCFWCMEAAYQGKDGVRDVVSGFTGGTLPNPTYRGNHEGHFEAIEVTYDPAVIGYRELLDLYWVNIDPFDDRGQFCDKGFRYRSAIFVATEEQRQLAEASLERVRQQFPQQTVHTEIREAGRFWPVEEAHQDYYLKNPARYKFYRWNCGRDQRLQQIWGDAAGGY